MLEALIMAIGFPVFGIASGYLFIFLSKHMGKSMEAYKDIPYKMADKEMFRGLLRYIFILCALGVTSIVLTLILESTLVPGLMFFTTWLYMTGKGIHLLVRSKSGLHPNTRYNIVGIAGALVFFGAVFFLIIAGVCVYIWAIEQEVF